MVSVDLLIICEYIRNPQVNGDLRVRLLCGSDYLMGFGLVPFGCPTVFDVMPHPPGVLHAQSRFIRNCVVSKSQSFELMLSGFLLFM